MKSVDFRRIAAILGLLLIACGDQPIEPAHTDGPAFAKPPNAGGGSKGSGADVALQGGMNAASQRVSRTESSDQLGLGADSYTLTVNLGSLVTASNLTSCLQEPDPIPPAVLDVLVQRLSGATHLQGYSTTIDKQAALAGTESTDHGLALREDWWLQLGKNHDRIGAGWPTIVFEGPGSIDDATQVRVFRITNTTGDVRVTERYDGNGDGKLRANDPVAHLTCPLANMEDGGIEITVAPGS
jgi:hypothetical protein